MTMKAVTRTGDIARLVSVLISLFFHFFSYSAISTTLLSITLVWHASTPVSLSHFNICELWASPAPLLKLVTSASRYATPFLNLCNVVWQRFSSHQVDVPCLSAQGAEEWKGEAKQKTWLCEGDARLWGLGE